MAPYTYEFPRPAVSVDIVLFTLQKGRLYVLLIQRGKAPFFNEWALPGGFVNMDETLHEAALRELGEETGVHGISLKQLHTYDDPGRDPRGRVISVAFYTLLASTPMVHEHGGDDAAQAQWFGVEELPELAFDHADILTDALIRLRHSFLNTAVGYEHLPDEFSLEQLEYLYTGILGDRSGKSEFKRRLLNNKIIEPVKRVESKSSNQDKLYRFHSQAIVELNKL